MHGMWQYGQAGSELCSGCAVAGPSHLWTWTPRPCRSRRARRKTPAACQQSQSARAPCRPGHPGTCAPHAPACPCAGPAARLALPDLLPAHHDRSDAIISTLEWTMLPVPVSHATLTLSFTTMPTTWQRILTHMRGHAPDPETTGCLLPNRMPGVRQFAPPQLHPAAWLHPGQRGWPATLTALLRLTSAVAVPGGNG